MRSNADEQTMVEIKEENSNVENTQMVEVEVIYINDDGENMEDWKSHSEHMISVRSQSEIVQEDVDSVENIKIEEEDELWTADENTMESYFKREDDTEIKFHRFDENGLYCTNENEFDIDSNFLPRVKNDVNDGTENDSIIASDMNTEGQNYELSNVFEVFTFDQRGITTRWSSDSAEKSWRYECTACNFRVIERKPFLIHMSFHSGNKTCYLCSEKFETVFAQRTHLKHTHSLVKWNCSACNFKSENYIEFKKHRLSHEDDVIRSVKIDDGKFRKIGNAYRCEECRYDVDDLNRYLWHLTLHRNNTVCYFCHEIFSSRKNLPRHLRNKHSQFKLSDKRSRKKSKDENVKRFKCATCGITTRYKSSLLRHNLIHARNKPKSVPCPTCGKCFWARSHLKMHVKRVHQDIRKKTGIESYSFLCNDCDFKCHSKIKMMSHVRCHMSKKKYECGWCEYSCSDVSGMHKHVRIHTGEKPYACTLCSYRSRDATHLKKHYVVHNTKK